MIMGHIYLSRWILFVSIILVFTVILVGCGLSSSSNEGDSITVYSGRNENLVAPVFEKFEQETGIKVNVRYGQTAELAATILEEGNNSPADLFLAQDAGALGAISQAGLFSKLPGEVLEKVEHRFRSPQNEWIGLSGRPRVVAYNTNTVQQADLPKTILGFTSPEWRGRIGWAPTNGSFQAFITAMRINLGEETTRQWLEGIQANNPRVYSGNTPLVEAIGRGEVEVGFTNHYYLYRFKEEQGPDFPVANFYLKSGDPGALVNVAGIGILRNSKQKKAAQLLVEYFLSEEIQTFFVEETKEYPLLLGLETPSDLSSLKALQTPDIDLGDLADLENTLLLLQEVGVL